MKEKGKDMSEKENIAVVVDSTAYIPDELVARHNIHVIPEIVNWAGESLYDGIDITPEQFYARLAKAKEMPTTSQPSAGEFYEFFTGVAESADAILCLTLSGDLSGTLASAHAAAEMMPDLALEIVDSRSTSMGLGFMALEAARAIENGADLQTAAAAVRALIDKMNVVFVVDTLEFLHRGGRIGGAQRFIGSMLSVKPILHLENGRIEPLASVRTKRKAVQHMLDHVAEGVGGQKGVRLAVLHAAAADEAQTVGEELRARLHPEELLYVELSPVIGTHVGPGAVGVAYYVAQA